MFKLHESTRRRLCRAAFVLFAIVPTASLVAWGAMRHAPGYEAGWEQRLSVELGLVVRTDAVTHPRPGHLLFTNLRLLHPETGAELLRCPKLEASWYGDALILAPTQPLLADGALDALWNCIDRRLRGHAPNSKLDVHLAECHLTSQSAAGDLTLEPLSGSIRQTADGPLAQARFKIAGQPMTDDATLTIWRRRGDAAAVTEIEFSTGATPIPCVLLAPLVNVVPWVGDRTTFQGVVSGSDDGHGAFRGTVSQIDLQRLISGRFAHQMSGSCNLQVETAGWGPDGLTLARGAVYGQRGLISHSFVNAAAHSLTLGSPVPGEDRRHMPYDELAFKFEIDPNGLVLEGLCQAAPGTILANQGAAIWIQPANQPQQVANLLRALVPNRELQAPATAESRALIRILPLPSIDKMAIDAAPRVRVTGPPR